MTYASDDLTPLLLPPPSGGSVSYGQGTIVAWNPDTFESAIEYRGVTLTNLPVLSGTDALSFAPGDTVAIMSWQRSYFILGRVVVPGSEKAERAIQFLQTNLARQIAAEVFADRIHFAAVLTSSGESVTGATWQDLSTVGPKVTVQISPAGAAIVVLSARLANNVSTGNHYARAFMDFEISDSSGVVRSPGSSDDTILTYNAGDGTASPFAMQASLMSPVTGLAAGQYTFTAKYASVAGVTSWFEDRKIIVIAF